jgi:signal transduction histidine kinase
MAQPELLEAPPTTRRRWTALGGLKDRLVRLVARAPVKVRTKLLVAFLGIAALLVLVTVLGLQVLGQANARVDRLDTLQLRSTQYQDLEAHARDLQQTLGVRDAGAPAVTPYTGGKTLQGGNQWLLADLAIADTRSQVELAYTEALFGFVPPPADERKLQRIRLDYRKVGRALTQIQKLDGSGVAGFKANPYVQAALAAGADLQATAQNLAFQAGAETEALVQANRSSYTSSRDLFIAVSAASVVLALGLGLIISWSLISPIQRTEARLEEISAGNFSGRLDVPNRDELGALARNVNRMNNELRRLYGELEATSRHKSEFLANMSHELRTPLNAIIGFSQVLRQRLFGEVNAKQEEYLDDILSSGNHLLSLINDVLDLSKVEAGQVELEVATFSLREALERGVVMVRERAAKNGVRLALEPAPDVDLVERGQVHPGRREHRRRDLPHRRRGAGVSHRHRAGHRTRGPGADLRGVPADRRRGGAARGDRVRACALETSRRAPRRPPLGRERARTWQPLRLYAAGRSREPQWLSDRHRAGTPLGSGCWHPGHRFP